MTLTLTQADWEELLIQTPAPHLNNLVLDDFEELVGVPEQLGRGHYRYIELSPGIELTLLDYKLNQDVSLKVPAHSHLIQVAIFLSGFLCADELHPLLGGTSSYFSGSGISPAYVEKHRRHERLTVVDVEVEPDLLEPFLLGEQRHSEQLKSLFKQEDWKVSFYPLVTPTIRSIAQQMWNVPYCGAAKRLYLQAKVFELLSIYFDWVAGGSRPAQLSLKPETIACLHHVKEILATRLEDPPSVVELAQQVGLNERTLQRGFRSLFGTTVVGYSMQQRLNYAETLLRQGDRSVAEVARLIGYGQLKYFAAIFRRQFGMTPSECLAGKKSVL